MLAKMLTLVQTAYKNVFIGRNVHQNAENSYDFKKKSKLLQKFGELNLRLEK